MPARNRLAQLHVREGAGQRRQPERERPVDEHGDHREARIDAEGDERADHPALHAADPARCRQEVADHADEEPQHDHAARR
jgi:hypothetical protein